MNITIHAGMRVLYKHDNKWLVGELEANDCTSIDEKGLYLRIIPKEFIGTEPQYVHTAEINNVFFDSFKLEDWLHEYPEYFMTKDKYIEFIESDDFDRKLENAYVSDGEYGYYQVTKFTRQWLEKQPFDYIVRGE